MRELISEYGKSILAAVATLGVIAVVLAGLALSGSLLTSVSASERSETASGAGSYMEASFQSGISEVEICSSVDVWETFDLGDIVLYGGSRPTDVHILQVTDSSEMDVTDQTVSGREKLCFGKEGVYRVTVSFTDKAGVQSVRKIYIGVCAG